MENQESVNQWKRPELLLLLIAAFLSPIIGGSVTSTPMPFASPLGMITGDPASPAGTRFFLSLFVLGSLAFSLFRMRSVPIPRGRIGLFLSVMLGALAFAAVISSFQAQSLEALLGWYLIVAAFFASIAAAGRIQGPTAICALVAGAGGITALRGIMEYADRAGVEPGYRIFGNWNNPNALAALLAILIPVGLSLIVQKSRPLQVLGSVATLLMSVAAVLTQSKGGILALGVGLAAWGVLQVAWTRKAAGLAALVVVLAGLGGGTLWQSSAKAAVGAQAGLRIAGGGAEAEQSAGFRSLLWKSAIDLTIAKPYGWGPGTFRYENARTGRQTLTVYAHQAYLQLAAEGGVIALGMLVMAAVFWLASVFRKSTALTPAQNSLRAGVVGAIFAFGANGVVESTLSYTGIGIVVFILLGVGLQLSSDGTAPELMPQGMRRAIALLACALPILGFAFFMNIESGKSAMMTAVAGKDTASMASASASLARNGFDGESLYYAGFGEVSDAAKREELWRGAAGKWPTPRVQRALARLLAEKGSLSEAILITKQVFVRDPNNLPGWKLLMDLEIQDQNDQGAEEAARKLVAIEGTTSFQIQSLPELVPTETYEARIWLSGRESDTKRKIELLEPAVEGYKKYLQLTVPQVRKFAEGGIDYGGETLADAQSKLAAGIEAARLLESAYRKAGDPSGESTASESVRLLEEAAAAF